MLGVSTDSLEAALAEKFPGTGVFVCDGDRTPTPASVEKAVAAWLAEPGSIMVATPVILPYLDSVPYGCIASMDSLLSIVQMPAGIPVGTLAIGEAGATNAGLLAAAILATTDPALAEKIKAFRAAQSAGVAERPS
mgnify:CR=1 FL=1